MLKGMVLQRTLENYGMVGWAHCGFILTVPLLLLPFPSKTFPKQLWIFSQVFHSRGTSVMKLKKACYL